MVWLPDGEKLLKICLFVLTKYTNMTDTHRHRHTSALVVVFRGSIVSFVDCIIGRRVVMCMCVNVVVR